jgi:hypothetical protein
MSSAEPEFEFSEQFCDREIRIPFSDLVEERPDDHVDRSDFMMTRDDLMMIASHANALKAASERHQINVDNRLAEDAIS